MCKCSDSEDVVLHRKLYALCTVLFMLLGSSCLKVHAEIGMPEVIKAASSPQMILQEDDSGLRYGATITFENAGAHRGVVDVSGAQMVSYHKSAVDLTTTMSTGIAWGRQQNGKRTEFEERFCSGWAEDASPWVVQMEVSQSKEKSTWYLDLHSFRNGKEVTKTLKQTLVGSGDSVLQFGLGQCRRNYFGLTLRTNTPGNRLAIKSLQVRKKSLPQYFRYTFTLDEGVADAQVSWAAGGSSELYVNGSAVAKLHGQGPLWRKLNTASIMPYLRPGKNVIGVFMDGYGAGAPANASGGNFFFLRGGIRETSGNIVPILTSDKWKASTIANAGWQDVGADDSLFAAAISEGPADRYRVGGQPFSQWAEFREFPYFGELDIQPEGRIIPIFVSSEHPRFTMKLLSDGVHKSDRVKYSIFDSNAKKQIYQNEMLCSKLSQDSNGMKLEIPQLSGGAYILDVEYDTGETLLRRRVEFVQTARIEQGKVASRNIEEGLNRRKVSELDFSQAMAGSINYGSGGRRREGVSGYKPNYVSSVDGSYVETGLSTHDWVSARFAVEKLYKPHLLKIEIPNNEARNSIFLVAEGDGKETFRNLAKGSGFIRGSSGVFTTHPDRGESKSITEYMLFWPNKLNQTFTIVNAGGKREKPAAVSKVTVYELGNTLPEFTAGSVSRSTLIGPFVEQIDRSIPPVFYSGPLAEKFPYQYLDGPFEGYYAAWYTTIRNLITYLKFSGQNTLFAGVYMYYGGWLPEPHFNGWPETGRQYLPIGWRDGAIELMARMFEENDLNIVLSVQFIGSPELRAEADVTDADVKHGVSTSRLVSRWGEQVHAFQDGGYNFMAPEVGNEMRDLARFLAHKYSQYSAIRGIMWHRLPEFPIGRNDQKINTPLDVGYGDLTIDLFQKYCSCKVPGDQDNPERFSARYQYLVTEKLDDWLRWRSEMVWEMDRELSDLVKEYRPDWNLITLVGRPDHGVLTDWDIKKDSIRNLLLEEGVDPDLYIKNNGLSLLLTYDLIGGRKFGRFIRTASVAVAINDFNSKLLESDESISSGWFFHAGFMIESYIQSSGEWPWKNMKFIGYSAPDSSTMSSDIKSLVKRNMPGIYVTGWNDRGMFVGRESVWRGLSRQIH